MQQQQNQKQPHCNRRITEQKRGQQLLRSASRLDVSKNNNNNKQDNDDVNLVTKASWYGVELFGKVFGNKGSNAAGNIPAVIDRSQPPQSLQETYQRIKEDNDRDYFLSGLVDGEIYDLKCIFSDPFVSFSGRDRFVDNLQNLGSFITNYTARTIKYDEQIDTNTNTVSTKIMVKLELNLPWKPVLAWPWGVTYTIDPITYLITDHQESWDIEAWEGVKQIFRKPTTTIQK